MKEKQTKIIDGKELTLYGFNLKKNGKERYIYKADGEAILIYKNMATKIYGYYQLILTNNSFYQDKINRQKRLFTNDDILLRDKIAKIPHAFIKGRSAVTNAAEHIGFDLTIKLDIKDFFGSIKKEMLAHALPEDEFDICFINNTLPQGLATSPVISNLAMISIDEDIYTLLSFNFSQKSNDTSPTHSTSHEDKQERRFVYTRYADDITISLKLDGYNNGREIAKGIILYIAEILAKNGFEINHKKTKIMFNSNGYRTITGISVNQGKVKATRKTIKKIRAAMHQANLSKANGLLNWVEQIKRVK